MRVECPHQDEAQRECPGCTFIDVDPPNGEPNGRRYCDGVVTGHVHHVPGKFTSIKDARASCGCDLDHDEWQAVHKVMFQGDRRGW